MRDYYLDQLGIVAWEVRHRNPPNLSKSLLDELTTTVSTCTRCPLHLSRSNTVFARGNPDAKLMVVGEAPGFHEDQQGLPFVGKAGGLLNNMLSSVGFSQEQIYIANVLKCRPPNNRDPQAEEIKQCGSHLSRQIELINPALILAVGRFAGQYLLKSMLSLAKMRSRVHQYEGIDVIVSYHPAYLLRNPSDKKKAYEDLLVVKSILSKV